MAGWDPQKSINNVEDAVKKDLKAGKPTAGKKEVTGTVKTGITESVVKPAIGGVYESTIRPTLSVAEGVRNKTGPLWKRAEEMAAKWGGKVEDWWGKMQDSPSGGMNIPKVGGVGTGMPGGGAPSAPVQIKAIAGGVGTTDPTGTSFRERQMTLAQELAEQAAGGGPSLATEQLKQSQAANQAAIFAQLASARGGANPGMARQAMQTSAQIQGQTARDAALARIQEQMGAREQLAGVSNQGRVEDVKTAGQANEVAVAQAQLAQQHAELQAKYTAMGLDAEKANQLAAIEMEKMDRGLMSPAQQALQAGTGILTSIFT